MNIYIDIFFFFSSRRRHTRFDCDWSSDVCSSDLKTPTPLFSRICFIVLRPKPYLQQQTQKWSSSLAVLAFLDGGPATTLCCSGTAPAEIEALYPRRAGCESYRRLRETRETQATKE